MREKIQSIKRIIIIYYGLIGLLILIFGKLIPFDQSMDSVITTMLCIYLIIFPIVLLYTIRYALHVFLFSLAFITGFYGFYHYSVDNHSISNALYFTFRLYLLDLADVFTQDGSSPVRYPLLLEIARWTAASYTITTIFIAMYRMLEKEVSLFFAQSLGNHHIIFSYNENSHYLIKDLRQNNERVIVVDEKFTPETQNMLESMKVIVVQSSLENEKVFQLCGAKKAKSITLFHQKDQESLYVLMKLESFFRQKSQPINLQKVIIHLEDDRYQTQLVSFLETVAHFSFPVEIINVYESIARTFWNKRSGLFNDNEAIELLIVGYNSLGKQIVSEAEKQLLQNAYGQNLKIVILDDFIQEERTGYCEKVPFNIQKDSLRKVIANRKETFTYIFICLDEAYIDLMEGIELSEIFSQTPIFMNFTDESIEQTLMIATTETEKSLYSIGTIQSILTKENLHI